MTPRLDVLRILTHCDKSITNVVYHEVQIYDKRAGVQTYHVNILHCYYALFANFHLGPIWNFLGLILTFVCVYFFRSKLPVCSFFSLCNVFLNSRQDKFISLTWPVVGFLAKLMLSHMILTKKLWKNSHEVGLTMRENSITVTPHPTIHNMIFDVEFIW